MEHSSTQEPAEERSPEQLLFEGPHQETVEILPQGARLSEREREQGVIAGVGRARVTRRVSEGAPPAAVAALPDGRRAEELLGVTYQIAGFFTIVIAGIVLAVAVAILATSGVAT